MVSDQSCSISLLDTWLYATCSFVILFAGDPLVDFIVPWELFMPSMGESGRRDGCLHTRVRDLSRKEHVNGTLGILS